MNNARLYKIEKKNNSADLNATEVAQPAGDWDQYLSVNRVALGKRVLVLGYKAATGAVDVYEFSAGVPELKLVPGNLKIAANKDIVTSFTLGNRPHLVAYTAKNGFFDIFALNDDLSLSGQYRYYRNHEPGVTKDFTTVKSFTNLGEVVLIGYDGTSGHVATYTVGVTATSAPGVPALTLAPAWTHFWAGGWTRFAFFQFGGSNFFLKTNTTPNKANVNIDHLNDVLAVGTSEVGSHLALEDDQALTNVEPFDLDHGEPHFATYLKASGKLTLNRFWGDCTGWTTVAKVAAPADFKLLLPIATRADGMFLLLA